MIRRHFTFFEEYHRGTVNILLHDIGFALWGIGVGSHNWIIIIVSPFIFESGHLYNYITGKKTKYDKKMIPIQLITWILFVALAFILTKTIF
jgi:hypothetical protein